MHLNIIDKFKVGENTSISVNGNMEQLKNGATIKDEHNNRFVVLSVAMVNNKNKAKLSETTELLLKGNAEIGERIYL